MLAELGRKIFRLKQQNKTKRVVFASPFRAKQRFLNGGLPPGGILSVGETTKRSRGLHNVNRTSVDVGMMRKWVKFQF